MTTRKLLLCAVVATLSVTASAANSAKVLIAAKVSEAPKLSAGAADPAWANAKPIAVPLFGGANFKDGATTATLKALYTSDTLYLLLQYDDPTQSVRRGPYQKQSDGSWKKVSDSDDKGGDNNKYYEDKFGLIWNINNSIKGFNDQGCMVACHAGDAGKPYGNKYTASEGEIGDMSHMKSIRTLTRLTTSGWRRLTTHKCGTHFMLARCS